MNAEPIHPPRDPRRESWSYPCEGFNPARPQYPGVNCQASNECATCPRWKCTRCEKLKPWCVGCAGENPTWCDDCAATPPSGER